jgi:hypothetical protein
MSWNKGPIPTASVQERRLVTALRASRAYLQNRGWTDEKMREEIMRVLLKLNPMLEGEDTAVVVQAFFQLALYHAGESLVEWSKN